MRRGAPGAVSARACLLFAALLLVPACAPGPTRVLTLNVGAADAPWSQRLTHAVNAVRAAKPDLLGVQDISAEELDALAAALPDYDYHATGSDDGRDRGEFTPLFWRRQRFEALDFGVLWLSGEPQRAGSVAWDGRRPRTAVWAQLRFRDSWLNDVLAVNARLDDADEAPRARAEAARFLRRVVESRGGEPVILLGDLGAARAAAATAEDDPERILTRDRGNLAELRECFARMGRRRLDDGGGSRATRRTGIILHSRRFETYQADVDASQDSPSGACMPVRATLLFMTATDLPGI